MNPLAALAARVTTPLTAFVGPYGWLVKWAVIAALALACAVFGAVEMHKHDRKAYDALAARYNSFVSETAAVGKVAAARAEAQAVTDRANKEKADAESKRRLADLDARNKRLLDALANSSGSIVPTAPAGAATPDRICFDRARLTGAISEFVVEAAGIAEAGDRAVIGLDVAKAWAQGQRSP